MAGISTSINLTDRMSGTLNRITASLYSTTEAFHSVDRASDTAFNPVAVQAITQEMYRYENEINGVQSELDRANQRIEEMENSTMKVSSAGNVMGSVFAKIGAIVATIGVGSFFASASRNAIDYASDLTEVQNVVDVTFEGMASEVNEWSKSTLEQFGLNELSAKQYAGTMGAILKSSGMAGNAVNDMAMRITELSGDMASFYNLDADGAFAKIRSGISGETEPLKQLGINMSVANLEAYAMSQGITTAYQSMSQAEQTTLRYNYLLQATADAQGDFARTSGSYANQTKLLKETWTAFTGEIATQILPMLTSIVQRLNSGILSLENHKNSIISLAGIVIEVLGGILSAVMAVSSFVADNWSIIEPIIWGIVAALIAYKTVGMAINTINGIIAISEQVKAASQAMATGATFAETVAQYGLNAALAACPITWIIMAIVALVAIIYAACAAIAKFTGVAQTGFGVICGSINVVLMGFKNLGMGVANVFLGIGNAVHAVANNMGIAFGNIIPAIQSGFYGLLATVIEVIAGIAAQLDALPFVSIDYSGLTDAANDYAAKEAEAAGQIQDFESISDAFTEGMNTYEPFEDGWISDAFEDGANWGDGLLGGDTSGGDAGITPAVAAGIGTALDPAYTDSGAGTVADGIASAAGNTAAIKDSVDISNENLKYLRDIAEQEAVNRFTTAEIKVDMINNNNVSSGMDLDGIVDTLSNGVNEAMLIAAEGVH